MAIQLVSRRTRITGMTSSSQKSNTFKSYSLKAYPLVLYNLLIFFALWFLMPVWTLYLLFTPKARAGFFSKLGVYPKDFTAKLNAKPAGIKRVWIHCVSVGELNAIRPLAESLMETELIQVVLTTTTLTGQTLARKLYPEWPVTYFPYDLRGCLQSSIEAIVPDVILLTETELWPNFIFTASQGFEIPVLTINGRISPRSFKGYRKIKPLMAQLFQWLDHVYAQSQGDAERLMGLGAPAEKVTVAGNVKFDIQPKPGQDSIAQELLRILNLQEGQAILVLASTHKGEDLPLVEVAMALENAVIVLAPRHPERTADIETLLASQGFETVRRSALIASETSGLTRPVSIRVVILDTIGELQALYGLSKLAVIAGSFEKIGGHNPLEALVAGVPVVYGPNMHNFPDIARLVEAYDAGESVADAKALGLALKRLWQNHERLQEMSQHGLKLLAEHQGATQRLQAAVLMHLGLSTMEAENTAADYKMSEMSGSSSPACNQGISFADVLHQEQEQTGNGE
jgi:3-deoxy-D-manno-octulosonic-acid transferase